MNWIPWALRTAVAPVHVHAQRMLLRMNRSREQDGMTVYADPKDGSFDLVFERVAAARRLLDRVDPARARRVRAMLPNLLVTKVARSSGFWLATRTGLMERTILESRSDAYVAGILVFQATFARLIGRGIAYTPRSQGRLVAACVREQTAFLDRLPCEEYPGTDRNIEWLVEWAATGLRGPRPMWMRRVRPVRVFVRSLGPAAEA